MPCETLRFASRNERFAFAPFFSLVEVRSETARSSRLAKDGRGEDRKWRRKRLKRLDSDSPMAPLSHGRPDTEQAEERANRGTCPRNRPAPDARLQAAFSRRSTSLTSSRR